MQSKDRQDSVPKGEGAGLQVHIQEVQEIVEGNGMVRRKREQVIDEPLARELAITIENDGNLYRQMYEPIAKNYARKMAKCTYDKDKAIKGIVNLVDEGLRRYKKDFGDVGRVSTATKVASAKELYPGIKELADFHLKEMCEKKPKSCGCKK